MKSALNRATLAAVATIALAGLSVLAADPQAQPPAIEGVLPGGPVFKATRPKPTKGDVVDIENLTTPPDGFRMQRRNNFYKIDGPAGEYLYRWAASGHWTNYRESEAGDFKRVPDLLKTNSGEVVKDVATWEKVRRPEIIKAFITEIYGKVPDNAPHVKWTVTKTTNANGTITTNATAAFVDAKGDSLTPASQPAAGGAGGGRGRGGGGPTLSMSYTIPVNAPGAVPLVQGGNAQAVQELGFGTLTINYQGVQQDAAAESTLHTGVVGLTWKQGDPRPADDWGVISAWTWAISRCIDQLEADPTVDAHQVAITGHSRYGKQVIIAGAMDPRIGLVWASCGGKLGAALSRRDWGDTVDDFAQLFAAHVDRNFQKYVGHWDELPVDQHMLVALMAPRPCLITGGTSDQWTDPVGAFWGGKFATPVYELYGKKGIDVADLPAPETFVGGDLAYEIHTGGHMTTAGESAQYMAMIQKYFKVKPVAR